MAAANTDKFKKLARKWVGSIGAGGVADGTVTTIPLSSSSGLPTDTAVVATIDRVDANGIATPSLEESVVGVVSGNNLVTCTRGAEGTAQAHSAGAVVEVLFTNKVWGDLIDGILAEHSQAGAHTTDTINEKTEDAGVTVDGVKHKDGQVYTDQINEKTDAAGVTIDGLKIKDGSIPAFKVLQSNDTSFSTNSTSFVDTGASLDITIPTGQKADILLFGFSSLYSQNQAIVVNARIAWNTGGTPSYGTESMVSTVALLTRIFMSFSYLLSDVDAGSYTTKVQMKVSADQITCNSPGVYLNAIVIPK